jgi:uncharacterized membrane protein
MHAELLVLRVVHILGAILWAGTSLFVAFFLLPAMGMAGPAAAPLMGALVKRKLFTIIPAVAVITMLAGLRMMWLNSTGFSASYFAATGGRTYVAGAVLALAAFTLFMIVNHPAIGRMMQLGQQVAQASESERGPLMAQMNALRARAGKASLMSALLLTLAAVTMAVGRYM